jgi:hypothetical protein
MRKKIALFILFLLQAVVISAQNQNISNYIFGDTEPYIAVNPTNPANVIAAWIKVTGFTQGSIAISYSNDAGVTWSAPQNAPHFSSTFTSADPSIDFNAAGKAFLTYVDYKLTMDSGKVLIISSVNGGQTWSSALPVIDGLETPDLPVDRPWVAVDRSGGMFDGRVYVTSKNVEDGVTTNHVYMKYSSDDGVTWSPLDILDDSLPTDLVTSMGALAIGANGSVNVSYFSWHLPLSLALRVVLVKSTDGGVTFTPHVMAVAPSGSGINDTLQFSATLSANPVNAQNMVFTYTSAINGDADILSFNSADGGITWSSANAIRVNDDAIANGNEQDMSWAGFSPNGIYGVAWRDRRNSGDDAVSPFEIWTAASYNGGVTFGQNVLVSSVLSPDIPVQRGNDFIGVAASNTFLHISWCDYRAGNYEIFYNRDSLASVLNVQQRPDVKPVVHAFPNPFTERMTFSYWLPADQSNSAIEITDVNGKIVRTIFTGTQSAGQHDVVIDGNSLAAGIYFFTISGTNWKSVTEFIKE